MKTTEYKSTRLVLTKDEKQIAKSWGGLWSRFGTLERSGKPIILIFGDWSGYRSSQYRITHVDYASIYGNHKQQIDKDFHGTVQFTDNTTMQVWCEVVTRRSIIERNLSMRKTYNKLINDLIKSGKSYYKIADEIKNEIPAF